MRRFPPRDLPPRERRLRRDLPRSESPFDRLLRRRPERDPAPFIIGGTVGFLALVIILLFLFSRLLGGDGGGLETGLGEQGIRARPGRMPPLPPGLVALSDFVEFETEGSISASIGIELRERITSPQGVGFYTFLGQRWRRVADAELVDGGRRAQADFSPVPKNLAVLKVVSQAYQVAGALPSGEELHPEARVDIISPRDYVPAEDGSILGTATDLEVGEEVLLIPSIVASDEDTANVVNGILADDDLRAQHREEIVRLVRDGGFDGIDLEYTGVDPTLRSAFTEFVQGLAQALHAEGARLSVALPPPLEDSQAYDWSALGEAVDMIRILPILDPVAYWEEMPRAVERALAEVDAAKLMLVVSPFSVETGPSGSSLMNYRDALMLASEIDVREPADPEEIKPGAIVRLVARNLAQDEGASGLFWSDEAAAVAFSPAGDDGRTIFLENVFSVAFKLELVQAYGLAGVVVSDASPGMEAANIWPAVNQLVETGTVTLVRPNEDAFLPRWEALDGGDLKVDEGSSALWVAPEELGSYDLRLIISDGRQRFARRVTVQVVEGPQPSPTPVVTFPPEEPSPTPEDNDGDGVPNEVDNCPEVKNPGQEDTVHTGGPGDACDDPDADEVADASDNCPDTPNFDQADLDGDGLGDVCDDDDDDDGVLDSDDNCPATPNPGQEDADLDGIGDVCDADQDNDGIPDTEDTEGPSPNTNGLGGIDDCADGVDNDGDGLIDGLPPPDGPDDGCVPVTPVPTP